MTYNYHLLIFGIYNMKKISIILSILALTVALQPDAKAEYTAEYLPLIYARGIDDSGNVVGTLSGSTQLNTDGTISAIPCGTEPYAIRDGVVVGTEWSYLQSRNIPFIYQDGICTKGGSGIYTDYANSKVAGYSWTVGGNPIASSFYGNKVIAFPGSRNNRAEGVNVHGVVAGWSQIPTKPYLGSRSPLKTVGWLWTETGGFIKQYPGYLIADVNDLGEVLSMAPRVIIHSDNSIEQLQTIAGTFGTWVYEMNNAGDVVGMVRTSGTSYTYSGIVYKK